METRLLRTLSDNGEPLPAPAQQSGQGEHQSLLLDMLVEGPVAGVGADQHLWVSSPASESSKAGESSSKVPLRTLDTISSFVPGYPAELTVFSPVSYTESGCEGSGTMGDEDEGFHEEFDSEEAPLRPAPTAADHHLPPLNLQELNSTDLQSILMENSLVDGDSSAALFPPFPAPALLDDSDPGVFVTEMESTAHSLLGIEGKSPVHSPFPLSSPSPVCATLNSMTLGDNQGMVDACSPSPMDEWSTQLNYPAYSDATSSVADSEYGSTVDVCASSQYLFPATSLPSPSPSPFPATSLPSPSPPPSSHSGQHYNLDMLCNQHPQTTPYTCHSPSPSPSYHHSPAHLNLVNNYNGGGSPTHSSLPSTPPPPSSLPHGIPSPSSYHHHHHHHQVPQSTPNYEGDPLISGQFTLMHGGAHSPSPSLHGTATTATGSFASCSTQTPLGCTPSPAPSPSHAHPTTLSDSDVPKKKPASTADEKLVHMPFYKFKKILDSPTVPEEKKADIKNVRRRGKNKIAAKNCRQRKQELVLTLQQEIDELNIHKNKLCVRGRAIEQEIKMLRGRCLALSHRNKQQQQCLPQ